MSEMAENNIDSHRIHAIVSGHNSASTVTAVTFVCSRLLFISSIKRFIIRDTPKNPFCAVNILIKDILSTVAARQRNSTELYFFFVPLLPLNKERE